MIVPCQIPTQAQAAEARRVLVAALERLRLPLVDGRPGRGALARLAARLKVRSHAVRTWWSVGQIPVEQVARVEALGRP